MRKLRIVVFVPNLTVGGLETAFINLAHALNRYGHYVYLVCGHTNGVLYSRTEGLNVLSLNSNNVSKCIVPLLKVVYKYKIDFVITGMFHCNLAGIIIKLICNLLKINSRFITSIHTNRNVFIKNASIYEKIIVKMHNIFIKHTDANVCVSKGVLEAETKTVTEQMKMKSFYIPNIILKDNTPNYKTNFIFKPNEPIKFLYVGRLSKEKKVLQLVKWYHKYLLSDTCFQNNTFTILGDGPEYNSIFNYVSVNNLSSNITLHGFVDNPVPFYVSHDILLLNSQFEALSNVIVEAIAHQCLVISSNCNFGPYEILQNKYGYLFEIDDEEEFIKIVTSDLYKKRLCYDTRKVVELYTEDSVLRNYNCLFHNILSN